MLVGVGSLEERVLDHGEMAGVGGKEAFLLLFAWDTCQWNAQLKIFEKCTTLG